MAFWLSGSGRTQNKQLAIWLENIILGLHGEVNCSALKNCREVPHLGESGMPQGHQGAGEAPGNLEATTRGAERSGPTESGTAWGHEVPGPGQAGNGSGRPRLNGGE